MKLVAGVTVGESGFWSAVREGLLSPRQADLPTQSAAAVWSLPLPNPSLGLAEQTLKRDKEGASLGLCGENRNWPAMELAWWGSVKRVG